MYMLDTNICIYLIRSKSPELARKITDIPSDDVYISTITQAELEYGVAKSKNPVKNAEALTKLLSTLNVISYDTQAAELYGVIRADLERRGCIIGALDLLIASHAKSRGFTVITHNANEFNRVKGLNVEDWV